MSEQPLQTRLLNRLFYFVHRFNKIRVKRTIREGADLSTVFGEIYRRRFWQRGFFDESVSGLGSRLVENETYVGEVMALMREFGLTRIFDCSCGDMNWAESLVRADGIVYSGGDIVPELVAGNRAKFGLPEDRMQVFDLTVTPFPDVDLWHCKDTLFHLSYDNIFRVLENFSHSSVPYVLVTTQFSEDGFENRDIANGNYRPLDLRGAPFGLGEPLRLIDNGFGRAIAKKSALYSRQTVADALHRQG